MSFAFAAFSFLAGIYLQAIPAIDQLDPVTVVVSPTSPLAATPSESTDQVEIIHEALPSMAASAHGVHDSAGM